MLTGRIGFPEYLPCKIQCPVLTQDKFTYLKRLPSSMVNPTAAFMLSTWHTVSDYRIQILPALPQSTNGYVVKFPYTTNSTGIAFCPDLTSVCEKMVRASKSYDGRIPYALIQPRLINRQEYKVFHISRIDSF